MEKLTVTLTLIICSKGEIKIIINRKIFYVQEGGIRVTRFLMLMNFKPLFKKYYFKYTKLKLE